MLKEYLSTLANAFREVLGTTKKINAQNFKSEIYSVFAKGLKTGEIAGFEQGKAEGVTEGKPLGKLELLQDSEYMNAKVSGTAIAVNDVSPIEHSVGCRVASKNMFDISKIPTTSQVINNGDGTLTVKGIGMPTNRKLSQVCPNLKVGDIAVISLRITNSVQDGKNAAYIYLYGVNETWQTNRTKIITQEMLDSVFYVYAAWWTSDGSTDGVTSGTVSEIQVELGTTTTEYTPYVADVGGIEVSRYGKNLFDVNLDPHSIHYAVRLVSLNDGELTIKQNATAQYASYNIAIPNAKKLVGKTITISCDCKVGEGGNNTTVRVLWLNSNGGGAIAGTDILYKPYISSTEYQHISVSGVVNAQPDESHDTLVLMFYGNVTGTLSDGEYYSYFKNIQIELGTTATDYEPYTEPTTYQSTADGTVDGIKSISPNMTLLSNNNGVVINANYLRDIDTYIDNLITNVALTGGE